MPIVLTDGNDQRDFSSTSDPLEIYALDGNDNVRGSSSSDYIDGGNGNDFISGNEGNDTLIGGEGDDFLFGGNDDDVLYAGTGADGLDGGMGNDTLFLDGSFAAGADTIHGSDGNDVYVVSNSNFVIVNYLPSIADPGRDRIEIAVSLSLAPYGGLEDLKLTGTAAINGTGNALDNLINGNNAANILNGGDGNDLLLGNGGADTLTGGFDAGGAPEYLYGGAGDDIFVVMDLQDTPVEFAGGGKDTVKSSIRWVLGDELEDLVLTGTASVNGFGNALVNRLTGNSGANYLQGFANFDTLVGRGGNDYYELGDRNFTADGDYVYDTVSEDAGGGIDFVQVTPFVDPIVASNYTLGANVENGGIFGTLAFDLTGNRLDNGLTGNDGANTLTGNAGNDTLSGGFGDDAELGGTGNDTYILGDVVGRNGAFAYDMVIEAAGEGTDTVRVEFVAFGPSGYTLPANVENGVVTALFGPYPFNLTGNKLDNMLTGNDRANTLTGNAGNDTFSGGLGDDTELGGTGNDTYVLDDVFTRSGAIVYDTVVEAASEGTDTIMVGFVATGPSSYTLGANVENGVVTGTVAFSLIGNERDNALTGNGANNALQGLGGNDRLNSGAGSDALTGGLGRDMMNGETGNDRFDFNAIAETGLTSATRDVITGFTHLADDIDLATIDAIAGGGNDAFVFRGVNAFTAAGQVRLQQAGADTIVEINTSGASIAEATIQLTGITATTLTAADFIL